MHHVDVEVDTGRGLPGMVVVGLADKAIMESRDRVKTAMQNAEMPFPRSRITVNLAPADLRKEGPLYDLPVALGIMICTGLLDSRRDLARHHVVGELALDGAVRPVHGALTCAEFARRAGSTLVLPFDNYLEASLVEGLEIIPVRHLKDLLAYFSGGSTPPPPPPIEPDAPLPIPDFSEVKGQQQAKRALMLAAGGGHNVLMVGPPGSGKSMLAERMAGILPELGREEALEITNVHSVAGLLRTSDPLVRRRPFRAPHHTISDVALIGGGADARPGEISLAHRGVLFLDELPEFKRGTLEVLRQPLESGRVRIGRARASSDYPSRFLLVAAMNPCPCGYYGSRLKSCRCSARQIEQYLGRLSGPLLDRIDLHIEVGEQPPETLRRAAPAGMGSGEMRARVARAREIQLRRYPGLPVLCNGELRGPLVERFCKLDAKSEEFLVNGMREMGLSTRAYHKVLLIARTIADLESREDLKLDDVAEALNYRSLDQKLFD